MKYCRWSSERARMPIQDKVVKPKWDSRVLVPNFLSIARLILLPLGLFYIREEKIFYALGTFGLIAATDAADGLLARRWSCTSKVGKILDHVVDKIVFISVTYALSLWKDFPLWAFLFLLVREVATVGVGGFLFIRGFKLEPNAVGRIAGFFFSLVLLFYFLEWPLRGALLWISLALLLLASLNYTKLYIVRYLFLSESVDSMRFDPSDPDGKD